MQHTYVSLEELVLLSVVNEPMKLCDAVKRAVEVFEGPRFDRAVALATVHALVGKNLLLREGLVVLPVRRGVDAARDTIEVMRRLENHLQRNWLR